MGEVLSHVEHLLDRTNPDDARLPEKYIHSDVGTGEGAGVGGGGPFSYFTSAGLDRNDRLLAGKPSGDAAESPRVAEGLQVEEDHPGIVVVLPEFKKVIGRYVNAVSDTCEVGDAEIIALHIVEERNAEGAAVGTDADAPALRHQAGHGGIQADLRVRVHNPETIRAYHPHAVGQGLFPQEPLSLTAPGT